MTIFKCIAHCVGLLCCLIVTGGSVIAQDQQPIDPLNETQLASEAERAMNQGEFERAVELWDALRERQPQSPQIPYNMGVAAYRQGEYERAAELFSQALSMTSDPALRRDSAYNLGTSAYAQSLAQPQMTPTSGATEQIDRASEELQRALEHYRQALDVAPNDADARANAELAYRRLQNLEAMKRQLQQSRPDQQQQPDQNQQQNDDEQDQQQQQNDQPQDDEQQDNQQSNDQSQQSQQDDQQNDNQNQQQSSQPPSQQDDQNQGESPQPEEQQGDNQDQQSADDEQPEEPEPPEQSDADSPNQPNRGGMTKDEAERLLQMVRDKQRRRQEQRKQEQASRLPPVDKDW